MGSSNLKRDLSLFICLLGAILILMMGCHVKNSEEHKPKKKIGVAENTELLKTLDYLKSVFSGELPPQQEVRQIKDMVINTMLPATSGKTKEKLNEIIKYLGSIEKSPSQYFDNSNNIIDLLQNMVRLTVIVAEIEPDNFDINYQIAYHYINAGQLVESLAQSEDHRLLSNEFKKKGFQTAKDLVERFPGEAKAYSQLAFFVIVLEGDKEKALELYKRCLELDEESELCKKKHDDLLEELKTISP